MRIKYYHDKCVCTKNNAWVLRGLMFYLLCMCAVIESPQKKYNEILTSKWHTSKRSKEQLGTTDTSSFSINNGVVG